MPTPTPTPLNPYVGPRTFERKDAQRFFGRETEARDLLALVGSQRLVLFYAQSGAGKSSLINTRLAPQLEARGLYVLPVGRVGGELPAGVTAVENIYLFNLMLSLDQGRDGRGGDPTRLVGLTLGEFLHGLTSDDGRTWYYDPAVAADAVADAAADASADGDYTAANTVLIVDQFEEIITTHADRWPERAGFFRQLDAAMQADPRLRVVLSLREDYVAALDPYAQHLADKLRARFYMERMGVEAALLAVQQPAANAGRPFAPGVAAQLVDDLRKVRVPGQAEPQVGQYVEPVQLQVVCYQLWENLDLQDEITFADLAEAGDVDRALTQFYEETLAYVRADPIAARVSERQMRAWFGEELITKAGTRGLVHQDELATGNLPTQVVRILQRRFLVRSEERSGETWIELVHDRFVDPIQRSNSAWFAMNSDSPVSKGALAWEQAGKPFAKELLPFASLSTETAKGCSGAVGYLLGFVIFTPIRSFKFLVGVASVKWLDEIDLQGAETALLQHAKGYTGIEQEYILASRGARYWRQLYRKIAWAWVIPLFLFTWFCGVAWRLPTIPTVNEKNAEISVLRLHASSVELAAANSLAEVGEVDKALRFYREALAQRMALAKKIDMQDDELIDILFLSGLCRWGVLWGRAEQVLMPCDQAVDAASTSDQRMRTRDGRGLARALTGDLAGAIEDFEFAVQQAQAISYDSAFIASRTAWIAALQAGENPFDAATLEQLRNE